MKLKQLFKIAVVISVAAIFVAGSIDFFDSVTSEVQAAEQNMVLKGKVLGVSKKAKTISIKDGDVTVMVKYNADTKGVEHATKDHAAIINYIKSGKDRVATVIKPKLAKLPEGVAEMKSDDLAELVSKGPQKGNYFLIDSRPGNRYAEGHIPTAVSIPVKKLKKTGAAHLPGDAKLKNTQLIFYCGGPT